MAQNALAPDFVYQGLVERGLPPHIAQGFVMNFQSESGLNPGINEAAPIVPGSRGGFGLAQWTGQRRRQLEAFAQQRGAPVSDPDVQMDFLLTELQGPESAAWQKISGASNAGEAGAAIVNAFLRPAEQHRAKREAQYLGGKFPESAPNALAAGPSMPPEQIDPVAMIERAQRQRQMAQGQQQQTQMPVYEMPMNALAEYVPQYDTRAYNTERLMRG